MTKRPGFHPDLRDSGSVLLISTYELGHQPLSVANAAAMLVTAGYRPRCIDIAVEPLNVDAVRRAQCVAISVPMHTALRLGVRVGERVRQINPQVRLCYSGLYAQLNAEHLREAHDAAAFGPNSARQLVDWLGGTISAEMTAGVASRDGLPSLDHYTRLMTSRGEEIVGSTAASHGCKHYCAHCPIPPVYGGRFSIVPRATVMQDVHQLVAAGARHISFSDADFLNGPRHAERLVRQLHDELPDLTYDFTTKVTHILQHADRFSAFAETGCLFVVSAVESLSDRVLEILDKGHTRHDVLKALVVCRKVGVALRPTFVPFTPWSTLDDYLELLAFIDTEDLTDSIDPIQLAIRLLIPPGSLLLAHPATKPHLGELLPEQFSYSWHHPDPRMDTLHEQVTASVESAGAASIDDPRQIIRQVGALAAEISGTPLRLYATGPRRQVPRLSEPWFC